MSTPQNGNKPAKPGKPSKPAYPRRLTDKGARPKPANDSDRK